MLDVSGGLLGMESKEVPRGYQDTWPQCGEDDACKGEELPSWVGEKEGPALEKGLGPPLSCA
jgi:hypothetical protein